MVQKGYIMILVDFSGICLATIIVNKELDEQMVRHMTLNSLRMYNKKFKENYGQMVYSIRLGYWGKYRRSKFIFFKVSNKRRINVKRNHIHILVY